MIVSGDLNYFHRRSIHDHLSEFIDIPRLVVSLLDKQQVRCCSDKFPQHIFFNSPIPLTGVPIKIYPLTANNIFLYPCNATTMPMDLAMIKSACSLPALSSSTSTSSLAPGFCQHRYFCTIETVWPRSRTWSRFFIHCSVIGFIPGKPRIFICVVSRTDFLMFLCTERNFYIPGHHGYSLYFLDFPLTFSTGYFSALRCNFSSAALWRSILSLSAMRTR